MYRRRACLHPGEDAHPHPCAALPCPERSLLYRTRNPLRLRCDLHPQPSNPSPAALRPSPALAHAHLHPCTGVEACISSCLLSPVENPTHSKPSKYAVLYALPTYLPAFAPPRQRSPVGRTEKPPPNFLLEPWFPSSSRSSSPVLETLYPLLLQSSSDLASLIHSSTSNDGYYEKYLSFHSVFRSALPGSGSSSSSGIPGRQKQHPSLQSPSPAASHSTSPPTRDIATAAPQRPQEAREIHRLDLSHGTPRTT